MEENLNLIVLQDEEGNEIVYENLGILQTDDNVYYGLTPYLEGEDLLNSTGGLDEFIIIKLSEDECFDVVTDIEEFDRIFEIFMKNFQKLFDFEDVYENEEFTLT